MREGHRDAMRFQHRGELLLARLEELVRAFQAFIGGFIGNMITGSGLNGLTLWSILLAIVGSLLLLWIYRLTTGRRV